MPARPPSTIPIGLPLVLAAWALAAVALWPFQPVPFVDDWVYAWSVENLLERQRLEVLDFSSNIVYAPALWGGLFTLPFGFSFTALRLSTWVLAGVAIAGLYRLLRETEASEAGATLGAASLAAYPPFLVLSFSFMTDVPLVAVEVWMLVLFVRAYREQSARHLWAGTGLAVVAAAIRVVGLVPAAAMSAALLFDRRGWGRTRGRFLIPLTAVGAAGLMAWYHQHHIRRIADLSYIENTPAPRLAALVEYAIPLLPAWVPLTLEFMAVGLGLALAPVALGLTSWPGRRTQAVVIAGGAALVVLIGQLTGPLHYPAFASEGTWISEELGSTLTLLPGWTPIQVPIGLTVAATLLCWASFVSLASAAARPEPVAGAPVLWWTIAGLVLMAAILWLATDRYILAFLAPALPLILGRGAGVSWPRAAPLLILFTLVGVVAVRDRVSAETAIWTAVNDLRQSGVPVSEIDAGYVVNGWLQYAHPDQAHRDERGNVAVPFVNGAADLLWAVAAAPLPGTTIAREYRFRRTWRAPGVVFVLQRSSPSSVAPPP